jgi:RNA polymerase sigma-70 factor (ECF subfamily)
MESPIPGSDEDLMMSVQSGDANAYHQLYQRHSRAVLGYLRRRVRDEEQAADLFQETWLNVHRGARTFKPNQRFRPWLFGIAVNTVRDSYRKQGRRIQTTEMVMEPGMPPRSDHPVRMTIEAAIDSLPEHLKQAFLLGAVQGFNHREVAAQLDISPDNARARISRARGHLRKMLKPE